MQKGFYSLLAKSVVAAFAATDLSIIPGDLTFSTDAPVEKEEVRIFARVFNLGETDVYGSVVFLDNDKEIAKHQPISVKTKSYDDVFIDSQLTAGNHTIRVKIINTNPPDNNDKNNETFRENYFVDSDTDSDKIGNKKDADDDNDGLSDQEEISVLKSNPLSRDTDNDGVLDSQEKVLGTSIFSADTDQDGIIDSKDESPLVKNKKPFSFAEAAKDFFKSKDKDSRDFKIWAGVGLFILLFLFWPKKKKH